MGEKRGLAIKQPLALYGLLRRWPVPYVYRRGLEWLRMGCCPCCYSSPPLPHCSVCQGSREYGRGLPQRQRDQWKVRWMKRRIALITGDES